MESRDPLIDTLCDLVSIDSVNPEWGGPGEGQIVAYLDDFFSDADIPHWKEEVLPGRCNFYACLEGQDASRAILLEAHMDIVSVQGMTISPFDPVVEEGKLYGRGACDTKAGLAAMIEAIRVIRESGEIPPVTIWFAAVIDEESAFRGVLAAIDWFRERKIEFEGAIVAEPTELRLVTTNKGVLRWRVRTLGKAAHSSKPHLGKNAISIMAELIRELDAFHLELDQKAHPLVGNATCNIGTIEGGDQVNFVPETCEIALDRRMLPGESGQEILSSYKPLWKRFPEGEIEVLPPDLDDAAMETPVDAEVFRFASKEVADLGLDPEPQGVPFGCDSTKLSRAGVPCLIFGPGSIDQAHAAIEWVELDQVKLAFDFYHRFLLNYGG
ncbi:MAG: M20 family metallopeptidase [Verrucomicrobiales bacterium]|nr:M20 family metallopeptidase [Verrucomicrobiales bacterium]